MKTVIQQEVLLVRGSTFFKMRLCEKDSENSIEHLSQTEQLEKACWNSLLNKVLPDIVKKSESGGELLLCQIRHGVSFLVMDLSESAVVFEETYSLNPYCLIKSISHN